MAAPPMTVDGQPIREGVTHWDIHGVEFHVEIVEESRWHESGWSVRANGAACHWQNLYADKDAARAACESMGWPFKE